MSASFLTQERWKSITLQNRWAADKLNLLKNFDNCFKMLNNINTV